MKHLKNRSDEIKKRFAELGADATADRLAKEFNCSPGFIYNNFPDECANAKEMRRIRSVYKDKMRGENKKQSDSSRLQISREDVRAKFKELGTEATNVRMAKEFGVSREYIRRHFPDEVKAVKHLRKATAKAVELEKEKARYIPFDNLDGEIWKDIEISEGKYQVSNFGRVKSQYKLISGCFNKHTGYVQVRFRVHEKMKHMYVHRLVAMAFIPNPDCKKTVNHIDNVRHHNHVSNLEWATQSENIQHAWDQGRMPCNFKPTLKPVVQLDMDGNVVREWESAAEASRHGYDGSAIGAVCRGERRKHAGFKWEFKKNA